MNRLLLSQSNALKLVSNLFPKMFSQSAPLQRSAVIFDMGGVLIDSPVNTFRRYEEQFRVPDNSITELVFDGENSGKFISNIR